MQAYKRTRYYNTPIRLSRKQKKRPANVLRNFFDVYHLDDIRQILEQWFEVAITTESGLFESARDRSNLLFFYRHLELITEAAYLLVQRELAGKLKNSVDIQNQSHQ